MGDAATPGATFRDEAPPGNLSDRLPDPSVSRIHGLGMTLAAVAFALGIAVGWRPSQPAIGAWLCSATALVFAAMILRIARRNRASFICLLASMVALGASWVTLRTEYVAPDDLAALIGDESTLVRVAGVATRAPELRARTSGSLARFDYRPPSTYFPMRIDELLPARGDAIPARGAILVRVDDTLPPFHAGDRVIVTGFLLRPAMPRNPGEFDFRQYAKSLRQAGILTVSSRELVQVTPADRWAPVAMFLHWRDDLRRRASAWLLAGLPDHEREARDALLVSLMLGERDAEIDRLNESFQRVGLAHILAISGFHLAVLAGFVLFIARLGFGARDWHGWIVIAAVLLYLLMVEPRTPVLRAGVMTIAACLGTISGRRLRVSGLVSLSAIALLMWRPDELFNPGFQLTYGVVLALIHLAPRVRLFWFKRPDPEAPTSAKMLGQWLYTAVAATVTAWLVATPIAAYHFGSIAPAGVLLSIVAVPLSAVILALGFAKMMLSALLPSAAMLLGVPLTVSADVLLVMVAAVDRVPGSSMTVPQPSTWWTFAALSCVIWWCVSRPGQARRRTLAKFAALALMTLWLFWPLLPMPSRPSDDALRIDMLAVGDGSCYVLRSGGETMMFDAGSSTDLGAGTRSIVPAMRRLGVRHVDRLCVTHANIDHFSAVVEIVEQFDVGEVRITPQFLAAARRDPLSPMAYMLERLTERRVNIIETSAGDAWTLGDCEIKCLNPPATAAFERVNDESMVLRIAAGDRRVLMCGDIQPAAIAMLMTPDADLRADVMELPHHGSHHDMAVEFVKAVQPVIVMQSTGWARWQRDRWVNDLAGVERLVTVRDGACSVMIARDGSMRVVRFLDEGVEAGGAEIE